MITNLYNTFTFIACLIVFCCFSLFSSICHSQATSTDWLEQTLYQGDRGIVELRVADLNNDQRNDLLVMNIFTHHFYWLENTGYNQFKQHSISEKGDPSSFQLIDIDIDGLLDIVSSNEEGLYLHLHKSDHTFEEILIDSDGRNCWSITTLDIDQDNDLDIVAVTKQTGIIYLFRNTNGNFNKETLLTDTPGVISLGNQDLDKDGTPDLIINSSEIKDVFALNPKTGAQNIICKNSYSNYSHLSDLNSDGWIDVMCAPTNEQVFHIHYNLGNWQFSTTSIPRTNNQMVTNIKANDLNNDLLIDVIYNDCEGNNTTALMQQEGGIFDIRPIHKCGDPHALYSGDYDSDGDNDIIVASVFDGTISLLENKQINHFSFIKTIYLIRNYKNINSVIFGLIITFFILFFVVYLRNTLLTKEGVSRTRQINYLKKKSVEQELLNINLQNLAGEAASTSQKIGSTQWSSFLIEYQKINPQKSAKLNALGLTKSEYRLAILTLSQLDTHEMSSMFGVDKKTIYIQRQRLKTKLNLKESKDIKGFLNEL